MCILGLIHFESKHRKITNRFGSDVVNYTRQKSEELFYDHVRNSLSLIVENIESIHDRNMIFRKIQLGIEIE